MYFAAESDITHSTFMCASYLCESIQYHNLLEVLQKGTLPCEKIWIVGNDPSIVNNAIADSIGTTIIGPSINRVSVTLHDSFRLKRFRKIFRTFSFYHAR